MEEKGESCSLRLANNNANDSQEEEEEDLGNR